MFPEIWSAILVACQQGISRNRTDRILRTVLLAAPGRRGCQDRQCSLMIGSLIFRTDGAVCTFVFCSSVVQRNRYCACVA